MRQTTKKHLIFYLVLIFLINTSTSEQKSLTKLGLFINSRRENRYFYSHKIEAKWTLVVTNPSNLFSMEKLKTHSKCGIKSKYVEQTANNIKREIDHIWNNELENLANYETTNQNSRKSSKRFLGLLFFGLAALISGYIIYHETDHVTPKTIDIIRGDINTISKNQAKIGSLLSMNNRELNGYSDLICDYYSDNLDVKIERYMSSYITRFEKELFQIISGEIPKETKFFQSLSNVCHESQIIGSKLEDTLTKSFCSEFTKSIPKLVFIGIKVDNELNVHILATVKNPILAIELNTIYSPTIFDISNVGFYQNATKYKIAISTSSILISGQNLFQLDKNLCENNMCSINSLTLNTNSNCLDQILNYNSTKGCILDQIEDPYCSYLQVSEFYIVSINKGLLLSNRWSPKTVALNFENLLLPYGQIYCSNHQFNYTINLPKQTNLTTVIDINDHINISILLEKCNETRDDLVLSPIIYQHEYFGIDTLKTHFIIYYLIITNILALLYAAYIWFPTLK